MSVIEKERTLNNIYKETFNLLGTEIEESKKKSISEFIKLAVNGDTIQSDLVVNVGSIRIPNIYIYILTNIRFILIKIENISEEISSVTYLLNDIINIERSLSKQDRALIQIMFKQGVIGLKYPQNHYKTVEFFQHVENCWAHKIKDDARI